MEQWQKDIIPVHEQCIVVFFALIYQSEKLYTILQLIKIYIQDSIMHILQQVYSVLIHTNIFGNI